MSHDPRATQFAALLRAVQLKAVAHGIAIEQDPDERTSLRHDAATAQDQAMEAAEDFVAALLTSCALPSVAAVGAQTAATDTDANVPRGRL